MPVSPVQRIAVALVAALVVVALVVVAMRVTGDGGSAVGSIGPSASGSASPSPTASPSSSATSSVAPSGPSGDAALAILDEIETQVERIRGLPPAEIGPPELITRVELAGELERIFDEEYPPEERESDNISLRAFGLLEPGQDVAELQLQLLGDGVLGFYDDHEKRMVVVTDVGLDAAAKITYAHEYTHALQDATFGLDTLETDAVGQDDRGLARTAMIEGDASTTMLSWAFQHMSEDEILEVQRMPLPDTTGIPSWMVAQLEFPYIAGQAWVTALIEGNVFDPNFAQVDAAYADPPDSTEQIIDFAKWPAREEPVAVDLPDLAAALGEGWREVDSSPVGQATISMFLEYLGAAPADAGIAADGWGGDRATVVSGPDGQFALGWRLAWDTAADAEEFVRAYGTAAASATLDFPAAAQALAGGEVLVVHASSQELHDAVVAIAGG